MGKGVRWLTGSVLLALLGSAQGYETAAPEVGAAASKAEHYTQAFKQPLAALYRWVAANPDAGAPPAYADLAAYMFQPPATTGYAVTLSPAGTGLIRLCMKAQLDARFDAVGFSWAANRAGAELANSDCTADNGMAARATGFPRLVAMVRTVDTRKVLSAAVLPAQPQVALPASGVVDLTNAAPSQVLVVTNSTEGLLQLQNATSSDASFALGSTCQTPVAPAATCSVEVALSQPVTVKRIARVYLTFSNGETASFSVRGQP